MASIWEASIKVGIGKLELPYSLSDDVPDMCEESGFNLLDLSFQDVADVEVLPHHHRDPFDRVQAMQCLRRDWTIVSRDKIFDQYGIKRIWD
jgi:PIN domain nuclease of toxin-antitoxin system